MMMHPGAKGSPSSSVRGLRCCSSSCRCCACSSDPCSSSSSATCPASAASENSRSVLLPALVRQQRWDLGSLRAGPRPKHLELQEETSAVEEHTKLYKESLSEDLRSLADEIVGRVSRGPHRHDCRHVDRAAHGALQLAGIALRTLRWRSGDDDASPLGVPL